MMMFSYEWKCFPILYDAHKRLRVQGQGNAAMCLAINKAKEELAKSVGMGGEYCAQSSGGDACV